MRAFFGHVVENARMDLHCDSYYKDAIMPGELDALLLVYVVSTLFEMARWKIGSMICSIRGRHVLVYDSWADSEGAGESFDCTRCGRTWSHIYY